VTGTIFSSVEGGGNHEAPLDKVSARDDLKDGKTGGSAGVGWGRGTPMRVLRRNPVLVIVALILPCLVWGQSESDWFHFEIPLCHEFGPTFWPVAPSAPLAEDAFVTVSANGHFEVKGQPIRFFGAQMSVGQVFPHQARADNIGLALSRLGFNHVRLHGFDRVDFPVGAHSIFTQGGTTRTLDPEGLDRLERLVAELKANGIYVTINLYDQRRFLASDGYPEPDQLVLQIIKGVNLFDPLLIELQKEFASQLLTHVSPYTGLALRDDPVLAGVQIANENSLVRMWQMDWLRPFSLGGDMSQRHSDLLDLLFNEFLTSEYGTDQGLLSAWGGLDQGESLTQGTVRRILHSRVDQYSDQRVRDTLRFLIELQVDFFAGMTTYLKEDLGVLAPVNGTNWHFAQADLEVQSHDEFRDDHAYWDHPSNWHLEHWHFHMDPMVLFPEWSFWTWYLGGARFNGSPWTITEFSHTFPNPYLSEGLLFLAAYGSLQGLDGVDLFSFGPGDLHDWASDKVWPFLFHNDPIELAMLPGAGSAFRHGLISPAEQTVALRFSRDDVLLESKRPVVVPRLLALEHALVTETFDSPISISGQVLPEESSNPFCSDTDEIMWDRDGLMKVVAPRFVGLTGFLSEFADEPAGPLTLVEGAGHGTLTWIALGEDDLGGPERSLLTLATEVRNTDMDWIGPNDVHFFMGARPTQVRATTVRLALDVDADHLRVFPLDERARSSKRFLALEPVTPGRFDLTLDQRLTPTLWFGLEPIVGSLPSDDSDITDETLIESDPDANESLGPGWPPVTWNCNPAYYGTGDGCDCGCDAPDPDCQDQTRASCQYCDRCGGCSGVASNHNSLCADRVPAAADAPPEWLCDPRHHGSGDGCDCGCGVSDPDCEGSAVSDCLFCNHCGSCAGINPENVAVCRATPGETGIRQPSGRVSP